jgi:hypothetical protein
VAAGATATASSSPRFTPAPPRPGPYDVSAVTNMHVGVIVVGLEAQVRALTGVVSDLQTGQRSPDGRWLSQTPAHALRRLGLVHRAELSGVCR